MEEPQINTLTSENLNRPRIPHFPLTKESLATSKSAKETAICRIKNNLDNLWENRGQEFFKTREGKELSKESVEDILVGSVEAMYEIYNNGGTLDKQSYQPLDSTVTIHRDKHVFIQTALASDIATAISELEPEELPQGYEGKFTVSDWATIQLIAVLHESGYLQKTDEEGPALFNAEQHEERGAVLTSNAYKAWKLENYGVKFEDLENGILGTKMKGKKPKSPTTWNQLTKEDLSHFIDLTAYAVDPNQVPDAIFALWEEEQFKIKGEAGPFSQMPKENYVKSGFMLPENPWGKEVFLLLQMFTEKQFSPWKSLYAENQNKLRQFEAIFEEPKIKDFQMEGSCDPWLLGKLVNEFGLDMDALRGKFQELMNSRSLTSKETQKRLPTWLLRYVYNQVPDIRKAEFIKMVFSSFLETQADATSPRQIEMHLAPLAWLFPYEQENKPDSVDAEAVQQFFSVFKQIEADPQMQQHHDLIVTLRREDGKLNEQLIDLSAKNDINQFDLAGFSVLGKNELDLIDLIHQNYGFVSLSWGQGEKNDSSSQNRARLEWRLVKDKLLAGDSLTSAELLIDYQNDFSKEVLEYLVEKGIKLKISVASAMHRGYTIEEIIGFLRAKPEKLQVQIIGGNQSIDEDLNAQLFRLRQAGMTKTETDKFVC
jgi:hypothetical protein